MPGKCYYWKSEIAEYYNLSDSKCLTKLFFSVNCGTVATLFIAKLAYVRIPCF